MPIRKKSGNLFNDHPYDFILFALNWRRHNDVEKKRLTKTRNLFSVTMHYIQYIKYAKVHYLINESRKVAYTLYKSRHDWVGIWILYLTRKAIAHLIMWTWLRKGKLKRQTEFLIITTRNNVMRTNYINSQKNSEYRFCGDRRERSNHIIGKYRKISQKEYKVGVIGWEGWSIGNRTWEKCLTMLKNDIWTN